MPSTTAKYFAHAHLPLKLQAVAKPLGLLAEQLESLLPDGPEKSAGMRKLLEAKDCFVRTALDMPEPVASAVPPDPSLAEARWGMGAYRADPKIHASDCAVHNEPAMPAGPCKCNGANCGATDGRHSRECIAEAGAVQGWVPTAADYANCGPSRVTLADIDAEITHCYYINAGEAHRANWPDPNAADETHPGLDTLTICILVLKNGTKVVGLNYGAIDPEKHDAARGREEARAQAVEKVWELLGFRLRDKLATRAGA